MSLRDFQVSLVAWCGWKRHFTILDEVACTFTGQTRDIRKEHVLVESELDDEILEAKMKIRALQEELSGLLSQGHHCISLVSRNRSWKDRDLRGHQALDEIQMLWTAIYDKDGLEYRKVCEFKKWAEAAARLGLNAQSLRKEATRRHDVWRKGSAGDWRDFDEREEVVAERDRGVTRMTPFGLAMSTEVVLDVKMKHIWPPLTSDFTKHLLQHFVENKIAQGRFITPDWGPMIQNIHKKEYLYNTTRFVCDTEKRVVSRLGASAFNLAIREPKKIVAPEASSHQHHHQHNPITRHDNDSSSPLSQPPIDVNAVLTTCFALKSRSPTAQNKTPDHHIPHLDPYRTFTDQLLSEEHFIDYSALTSSNQLLGDRKSRGKMNHPIEISEIANDERISEGLKSDSELEYSGIDNTTPNLDSSSGWQAQVGLESFGESLRAATQAVFPTETRPQYRRVFVLMISWEDEGIDQSFSTEVSDLYNVFENTFHFEGGDSEEDLKILFYKGDSQLTKNGNVAWARNRSSPLPAVQWSGIQNNLEQALSDVLVLLDCGHAGTTNNEGSGNTELIAASSHTSSVKQYRTSFSRQLEIEFRELSKLPSFSVGNLYHNIFCRLQSTTEEQELRTPLYLPLTQDHPKFPRSIRLSVYKKGSRDTALNGRLTPEDSFEVRAPDSSIAHSFYTPSKLVGSPIPHMAFAIRLKEGVDTSELQSDPLLDWLQSVAGLADELKIGAALHSNAPLLIVSLPICVAIYLPADPTIINLGPASSISQALNRIPIPKDLPTPDSDKWAREYKTNGTNGEKKNGKIVNGSNGTNGFHATSEIRPRKQVHIELPPGARPPLDKGYSSQFNIASSFTEEPTALNGNYDTNMNCDSPTQSHQIPTFGPHSAEASGPQSKAHAKIHTYTDDPGAKFPRISKPVELLRNSYDCVVIGSGYGGGVAASRMARAGEIVGELKTYVVIHLKEDSVDAFDSLSSFRPPRLIIMRLQDFLQPNHLDNKPRIAQDSRYDERVLEIFD
ncbi:hypothetical protein G7Y89_g1731 [Cudoniella acicularis]|uniref:Uncharacterized protein n=1 Tax=Cudoniella acicularis TaxID=354080 RepID=A0A8H4W6Q2_9HELO|nr:hypothetical protein G7Y89_g1731 [Cudoniella acicularis]